MGSAMRRMGVYLGLLEDTERYDEDYLDGEEPAAAHAATPPAPRQGEGSRPAPVSQLAERRRQSGTATVTAAPQVTELSRITTLHPTTYNDARAVGEAFRSGVPVIMNLSEMDDADAKRLVDFAAGLIFAVHGSIDRVTAKVFLLCPPNVSVAQEERARMAENGFFNQS
jgi:cell division inhibitor SepF